MPRLLMYGYTNSNPEIPSVPFKVISQVCEDFKVALLIKVLIVNHDLNLFQDDGA
jgi:hypothetical protein